MAARPRFDANRPLVAAREFTFMGTDYKKGDPFKPEGADRRLVARQYETRAVNHGEAEEAADSGEPVQMTGPKGGRYTITAPWLAEPEVVRGKKNADDRLAELREEGPPLGFIEGGTEVTVEGGEGGWYDVQAPWMDEAEKVQGREAAEARQREIHEAGAPAAETTEQQLEPGVDPEGNQAPEDTTVQQENKDTQTADTSPNEPGTNEPNGAEVINDQENAGTDADESGDDGEGGDGSTGSVGP